MTTLAPATALALDRGVDRDWDAELARLTEAQATFGPDGAVTATAAAAVAARIPLAPAVRRHLVAAALWSMWSLGWHVLVAHWTHAPLAASTPRLLVVLLGGAGLAVVAWSGVCSRREVLTDRERRQHELRRLAVTRHEPRVSRRSAS